MTNIFTYSFNEDDKEFLCWVTLMFLIYLIIDILLTNALFNKLNKTDESSEMDSYFNNKEVIEDDNEHSNNSTHSNTYNDTHSISEEQSYSNNYDSEEEDVISSEDYEIEIKDERQEKSNFEKFTHLFYASILSNLNTKPKKERENILKYSILSNLNTKPKKERENILKYSILLWKNTYYKTIIMWNRSLLKEQYNTLDCFNEDIEKILLLDSKMKNFETNQLKRIVKWPSGVIMVSTTDENNKQGIFKGQLYMSLGIDNTFIDKYGNKTGNFSRSIQFSRPATFLEIIDFVMSKKIQKKLKQMVYV